MMKWKTVQNKQQKKEREKEKNHFLTFPKRMSENE